MSRHQLERAKRIESAHLNDRGTHEQGQVNAVERSVVIERRGDQLRVIDSPTGCTYLDSRRVPRSVTISTGDLLSLHAASCRARFRSVKPRISH